MGDPQLTDRPGFARSGCLLVILTVVAVAAVVACLAGVFR